MNIKKWWCGVVTALFLMLNSAWAMDEPESSLSRLQREKLDALMKSGFSDSGTVGQSILVLENGKLVYSHQDGTTRLNGEERVNADTIFPVYSVTKLFVAALTTKLLSQGLMDMSHSVTDYLDSLPDDWQDVTIEHLLAHSSGLPEFYGSGLEKTGTVSQILAFLKGQSMAFPVNSQVRYNQTNFFLLKLILEKLHDKGFQEILADEFFMPFNLRRTTFGEVERSFATRTSHYLTNPENRVYHYYRRDKGELTELASPEFAEVMHAASGLNISGADMATWLEALLSGRYVRLEDLVASWQPGFLENGTMGEYSNGWQVLKDEKVTAVGHYGDMFVNVRHFFLHAAKEKSVTVIHLNSGGLHAKFNSFDFSYDVARIINSNIQLGIVEFKRKLRALALQGKFQQLHQTYKTFLQHPLRQTLNTEGVINQLGYQLLDEVPDAAVLLFKLNLSSYPDSANAYDSYAEGLYQVGNYRESKNIYEKAFSMAPEYQHIPAILEELKTLLVQ